MCQNQDSHWDYKNGYYFLKFDNKKIIGTIRKPLYVGALYIIFSYGNYSYLPVSCMGHKTFGI